MTIQASPTNDCLTVSVDGAVARIVFDNPRRKNAVDFGGWIRLAALMTDLGARSDVRAIVLSGAGGDFCAGADISEFDAVRRDAETARAYEAANSAAFRAIRQSRVPVVAAIDGICFGGGFGIAAACDLRVATPRARFAVPAARLGLAYPVDAMIDIVSAAGPQMARYLTMTAQTIDSATALAAGFLLEIVEADRLAARAGEIANQIAASAPLSVRASRLAIAATVSGDGKLAAEAKAAGDATFESADYAEGRAAFKERRLPVFEGR